jgi:DNA-3-methyladenine glycosylase II
VKKINPIPSEQTHLLINKPEHFRFEECLWFLDRNYDDCLHHIDGQLLRKAIAGPDGPLLFELEDQGEAISVRGLTGSTSPANMEYLRHFLSGYIDLQSPLPEFYELLRQDHRLAYMPQSFYGLRMVGIPDLFEGLVWSIIGQQINLSFAYRLKRRLVEAYGSSMLYQGKPYFIFPKPETLVSVSPEALRDMQFSGNKARYIIDMAQQFVDGKMSKSLLRQAPDLATRLKLLTDMRGVGAWTANYVLMKCLRETDCIPYGDTGLTAALLQHKIMPEKPTRQEIDTFFRPFAGWQSYLVFYLWRSLSGPVHKRSEESPEKKLV